MEHVRSACVGYAAHHSEVQVLHAKLGWVKDIVGRALL
jgi:hypothetical protein